MSYTTINKSSLNMNSKLYTGTGADNNAITGVGFQPNFTWLKSRTNTEYHNLYDSVRGATKRLVSNTSDGESTISGLTSFNSDGFTVGAADTANQNSQNFASWNWKAGTTASGATTGSGTAKTYSSSSNSTAGFSIVKYTGNGTSGHQIPHGCGSVPSMIIFKQLNASRGWGVYHQSAGTNQITYLDENIAKQTATILPSTPTSSVVTLGTLNENNINDATYIMYCFSDVRGYQKAGNYSGQTTGEPPFIHLGFKPQFILIKNKDIADWWGIFDNKRLGYNSSDSPRILFPNTSDAESNSKILDFTSNGFKIRTTNSAINGDGNMMIYYAVGQSLVGSNNVPCTAK